MIIFEIDSCSIKNQWNWRNNIHARRIILNAQNTSWKNRSIKDKIMYIFLAFYFTFRFYQSNMLCKCLSVTISLSPKFLFSEILPIAQRHFITSFRLTSRSSCIWMIVFVCVPFKSSQSKRNKLVQVCSVYRCVISRAYVCFVYLRTGSVLLYFVLEHSVCKCHWRWNKFLTVEEVWYLWNEYSENRRFKNIYLFWSYLIIYQEIFWW